MEALHLWPMPRDGVIKGIIIIIMKQNWKFQGGWEGSKPKKKDNLGEGMVIFWNQTRDGNLNLMALAMGCVS